VIEGKQRNVRQPLDESSAESSETRATAWSDWRPGPECHSACRSL